MERGYFTNENNKKGIKMTTRKTTLKKKIKGRLSAWVTAGSPSENYGFGSN